MGLGKEDKNIFDKIIDTIEGLESSFIAFVLALIPWAAPLLPAYFTYYHLTEMSIPVPWWVAIPMAATVEFLGLAATATIFAIMRHNKTNRAQKNQVALGFPVGAYLFYLLVVMTTNVIMELPIGGEFRHYVEIASIALLTLIAAPAYVILVVRQERRTIVTATDNTKKKSDKVSYKKPGSVSQEPVTEDNGWKFYGNGHKHNKKPTDKEILTLPVGEVAHMAGVSEKTVYRWRNKIKGRTLDKPTDR